MLQKKKCVDYLGFVVDCPDTNYSMFSPLHVDTIEVVEIGERKFAYKNGLYIGEIELHPLTGKEVIRTGYYLDTLMNKIEPVYYSRLNVLPTRGIPVELRRIGGRILVYDKITNEYIGDAMYDPLSGSYKLIKNTKKGVPASYLKLF